MSIFMTTKMKLLSAVVIEEKADNVAKELLSLGLLDFIKITKLINNKGIDLKRDTKSEVSEIKDLRKRLENLYKQAETEAPPRETLSVENYKTPDIAQVKKKINKITDEINDLREQQKNLFQEKLKINEINDYIKKENSFITINRGFPQRGSFEDMVKHFSSIPCVFLKIPENDDYLFVSLKRDKKTVENIFGKYEWQESENISSLDDQKNNLLHDTNLKINAIEESLKKIKLQIKEIILQDKEEIDFLWKELKINELYSAVRKNFSHTSNTCLFSGWLPAGKVEKARAAIIKASGDRCVIECSEAEKFKRSEIPVEIKHNKKLEPFQMLVENYAIPEYGTVDPTLLVFVTYMIMFGLMFADAGQGLVIILIGFLGGKLIKKTTKGVRKLLNLFIYCGLSSVATGFLFGSFFGYPLFPALWFNYHSIVNGHSSGNPTITNVYDILKITIYFGIAVIFLGLLLNWVNLLKKKDYFKLILDKSGFIGAWIFGCGIYTSFYFVGTSYKGLPDGNLLTIFFGIPALVLFFKEPLRYFVIEKKGNEFKPFKLVDFFMEWIVELLEIFSGYLANTLSFMRVAGLGIAHVSLMTAFDTIANMTSGFGSILILVIGNILVIALEGLSAGIQALRLNYYEFFSRYFTGRGIAYNPVSLRSRED